MDLEGSSKQLSVPGETNNDKSSIANLPKDILEDIFRRIRFKDLYYLRHVCKNWYNLLSNPTFADTKLIKPPFTSFVICRKNTLYLLTIDIKKTHRDRIKFVPIKPRRLRTGFCRGKRRGHVELVGACNGLLCVARCFLDDDYAIYVLNPLLDKVLTLPKPKTDEQIIQQAYGFGFSDATGQFKVLRIVTRKLQDGTMKSEGEVCTVGEDNTWRKIADDHAPYPSSGNCCSASLHGAIHWIVNDIGKTDYIFAFDVKEEKVRAIPPPPGLEKRKSTLIILRIVYDSLCVFYGGSLWRMKEYGVASSWSRHLIKVRTYFFPFGYSKAEKIFMESSHGSLFPYFEDFYHEKNKVIVYDPGFHTPKGLGPWKMLET